MRKIAFLLCLVLLFLTGCKQQETETPDPTPAEPEAEQKWETGTFHMVGGYLQNNLVYLSIAEQELRAPVNELAYYIVNGTDYVLSADEARVEIYRDGQWVEWEIDTDEWVEVSYRYRYKAKSRSFDTLYISDEENKTSPHTYYKPLQAGEYRIMQAYGLTLPQEQQPEGQPYLIAYFTVTES